jgi:hypothetical protein
MFYQSPPSGANPHDDADGQFEFSASEFSASPSTELGTATGPGMSYIIDVPDTPTSCLSVAALSHVYAMLV